MKLKEALADVDLDLSESGSRYGEVALDRMAEHLDVIGIPWVAPDQSLVRTGWIISWMCTDTRVGLAYYVMDGEIVAVSAQVARKGDISFYFASAQAAEKLRAYFQSLLEPPEVWVFSGNEDVQSWFDMAAENDSVWRNLKQ